MSRGLGTILRPNGFCRTSGTRPRDDLSGAEVIAEFEDFIELSEYRDHLRQSACGSGTARILVATLDCEDVHQGFAPPQERLILTIASNIFNPPRRHDLEREITVRLPTSQSSPDQSLAASWLCQNSSYRQSQTRSPLTIHQFYCRFQGIDCLVGKADAIDNWTPFVELGLDERREGLRGHRLRLDAFAIEMRHHLRAR